MTILEIKNYAKQFKPINQLDWSYICKSNNQFALYRKTYLQKLNTLFETIANNTCKLIKAEIVKQLEDIFLNLNCDTYVLNKIKEYEKRTNKKYPINDDLIKEFLQKIITMSNQNNSLLFDTFCYQTPFFNQSSFKKIM